MMTQPPPTYGSSYPNQGNRGGGRSGRGGRSNNDTRQYRSQQPTPLLPGGPVVPRAAQLPLVAQQPQVAGGRTVLIPQMFNTAGARAPNIFPQGFGVVPPPLQHGVLSAAGGYPGTHSLYIPQASAPYAQQPITLSQQPITLGAHQLPGSVPMPPSSTGVGVGVQTSQTTVYPPQQARKQSAPAPRVSRAIKIINPDTGSEVNVGNKKTPEPPTTAVNTTIKQPPPITVAPTVGPLPPLIQTPPIFVPRMPVPGGSDVREDFQRKVLQIVNPNAAIVESIPQPHLQQQAQHRGAVGVGGAVQQHPRPNAIIRNPNEVATTSAEKPEPLLPSVSSASETTSEPDVPTILPEKKEAGEEKPVVDNEPKVEEQTSISDIASANVEDVKEEVLAKTESKPSTEPVVKVAEVDSLLKSDVPETSAEEDVKVTIAPSATAVSTSGSEQHSSESEQKPLEVAQTEPPVSVSTSSTMTATDSTTQSELTRDVATPPQPQTMPPQSQVATPTVVKSDEPKDKDSVIQEPQAPVVVPSTATAMPTVTIATDIPSKEKVNEVKPIVETPVSQPPEQLAPQKDKLRTDKDKKRSPKSSPEMGRKEPVKQVEQVSAKTEKPVKPVESGGASKSEKVEKTVESRSTKADKPVKPVDQVSVKPVKPDETKIDKPPIEPATVKTVKPADQVPIKPVKPVEQVPVKTDKSSKPVDQGSKSEKSVKPSSKEVKREMKEEPKKLIAPPAAQQQAGKRTIYDRDFLLQFRELEVCKVAPPELPHDVLMGSGPPPPHYERHDSRDYGGHGGHGGGKKKKKISHQPAFMSEEKVELNKAAKPWVRSTLAGPAAGDEADKNTVELYRKFQGILNKLTPQKFQKLAEQALDLEIDSEEKLMGCIDKIFTKALQEPSFSIAYANLCKVLSPIKVDRVLPDGKSKSTNFRRVLLTKCQQEFEKDKKDDEDTEMMLKAIEEAETPEAKKQLQDELEVAQTQSRRRSLGNIRFIGELFKLKMLSETIMHECIVRLLRSSSDEESLECFARLITTTGKDLDHPQAKGRIDNYFNRIADIIKKGKIPARIKFMLQDIQELRNSSWTPRTRQDHQLKTLDQIRADAELEAAKELEMVQKHMVSKPTGGAGGRRASKQDDWQTKGDRRDKEREREREREKYDPKRILALSRRKESGPPALGPQTAPLRPGASGWGSRAAAGVGSAGSSVQDKDKKPSRSSSSGSKRNEKDRDKAPGRTSSSGSKRSYHTTADSQRAAAIQTVKQMTSGKLTPQTAVAPASVPAQVKPVEKKPPSPTPVVDDTLDEETLQRKTSTIIDELVSNKDFQEAVECVKELRSPELMNVFVAESINHTLEKSPQARQSAGELLARLIREQLLSQDKFVTGLNDILEFAEDIEVDVPRIWQYLGEILSNIMATSVVPLSVFSRVPQELVESGKASKLVAQTLVQCRGKVKEETELVVLWKQSQLQWTALGVNSEDLGEFLSRQGLEFLQETKKQSSQEVPYLVPLTTLIGAIDTTNDDICKWIQNHCTDILESPEFVFNLTTAVFQAVVSGSGASAIFNSESFDKRAVIIKNHVKDSKELQMSVLYALQIAVTKLEHPPRLLNNTFNQLYDLEVIGEEAFVQWRDRGTETYGKGNAVVSVKSFFEWLETESEEEEKESGTS